MSFKMLRRKSANIGGSGRITLLHAVQNCCSFAGEQQSEPNYADLQLAVSCLQQQASSADIEAVARFFKYELAQQQRSKQATLLVLNTINALINANVREFQAAVLKGANAILVDVEKLSHNSPYGEVTTKATELLQQWSLQFRAIRELSFRVEVRSKEDEDAFMQTELSRFDGLLSSLEEELSRAKNSKQLEENALVRELVLACDKIGPELRSMIELSSQDALTRLLEMNDRLLRCIALHEKISKTEPDTYNPFDDPQVMAQVFQQQPNPWGM